MADSSEPGWTLATLKEWIDERRVEDRRALRLQAKEYKRRLETLNHEHGRALKVQETYVTADKYEDKLAAEAEARTRALERVDEKFNDFVTRYELRQREVDTAMATARGAVEQAAKTAAEQQRVQNRNLGIATLVISVVIAFANGLFG